MSRHENLTLIGGGSQGKGNTTANKIIGSDNANLLAGGGCLDTVTGGAGMDTFVFDTAPAAGSIMRIEDFSQADDLLGLSSTAFPGVFDGPVLAGEGPTVTAGTIAVGEGAQFIYTFTSGALFYDADGDGIGAKVQIATFNAASKPAALDGTDFTVFNCFA